MPPYPAWHTKCRYTHKVEPFGYQIFFTFSGIHLVLFIDWRGCRNPRTSVVKWRDSVRRVQWHLVHGTVGQCSQQIFNIQTLPTSIHNSFPSHKTAIHQILFKQFVNAALECGHVATSMCGTLCGCWVAGRVLRSFKWTRSTLFEQDALASNMSSLTSKHNQ